MANQTGLEPASAIVQLQNLRVQEATDGVTLARKQNAKADFGADQYGNLIRAGLNSHARDTLQSCWQFKTLRDVANVFDAAIGIAQMAGQVAGIDRLFTRSGGHQTATRVPTVGYVGKVIGGGFIDNAQARLDSGTLLASHENRVADWNATGNLHSVRPLAASSNWRGRGCHRRPASLTGSERLFQPIYQHDQYAFKTEKRKLNLTQTLAGTAGAAEFRAVPGDQTLDPVTPNGADLTLDHTHASGGNICDRPERCRPDQRPQGRGRDLRHRRNLPA